MRLAFFAASIIWILDLKDKKIFFITLVSHCGI